MNLTCLIEHFSTNKNLTKPNMFKYLVIQFQKRAVRSH